MVCFVHLGFSFIVVGFAMLIYSAAVAECPVQHYMDTNTEYYRYVFTRQRDLATINSYFLSEELISVMDTEQLQQ